MATTQVETVNTGADKTKIACALILVAAGLAAFYMLDKHGPLVQWLSLLGSLVVAAVLFFTSEPGRQLLAFAREAVREVKKVVWPSRKEAGQVTLYVFGFVLIMALFLWFTDKTLEWVLYGLILGWKS